MAEGRCRRWRGRRAQLRSVFLAPEFNAADLVRQDQLELAADVQGHMEVLEGRHRHLSANTAADVLFRLRHHRLCRADGLQSRRMQYGSHVRPRRLHQGPRDHMQRVHQSRLPDGCRRRAGFLPSHRQRRPAGKRRQRCRLQLCRQRLHAPRLPRIPASTHRLHQRYAFADMQPERWRVHRPGDRHQRHPFGLYAARRFQHGQRRHRRDMPAQQFRLRHRQDDQCPRRLPGRAMDFADFERLPGEHSDDPVHPTPLLHCGFCPVLRTQPPTRSGTASAPACARARTTSRSTNT